MKKIILLALLITSFTTIAQDSVLLRINYNETDNYVTTMELNKSKDSQSGMFMSVVLNSKVISADNNLIMLESKVGSIVINLDQGGVIMEFDSNKSDEDLDQMGQMMKAKFDQALKATIYNSIDRYGNVLELKMEPSLPQMEHFSANQNSINFPDEEVSVGSSWESETDDNKGMKFIKKYTVTNIADGMISLDISGDISGTGTGTVNGKSTVEISSGMQTNSTIEMTIFAQGKEMSLVTTSKMIKI
tara:strand:+ start:1284 stop:2021 length:738 start_codon:yes stop_codon:yes gene_type:complete